MRAWCRWCRPGLFISLLALLALTGTAGARSTVQNDVAARSGEALEVNGLASVSIEEVDYRNVTLTGPASLENEAVAVGAGLEETRDVSYLDDGTVAAGDAISVIPLPGWSL